MILDTSAVLAVLLREEGWSEVDRAAFSAERLSMSAATSVELAAVLAGRRNPVVERLADDLLRLWRVEIVPFDADQARIAQQAYRDFGRGCGHPARLNLGDCFSYALARARGEELLFVGEDFGHTDVRPALS